MYSPRRGSSDLGHLGDVAPVDVEEPSNGASVARGAFEGLCEHRTADQALGLDEAESANRTASGHDKRVVNVGRMYLVGDVRSRPCHVNPVLVWLRCFMMIVLRAGMIHGT